MADLKLYRSYNFRDKDPIIDALRTAREKSGMSVAEVSEASGVSMSALYNWWEGTTRRPQFATSMAAARAMGYDIVLGKIGSLSGDIIPLKGVKRT